MLSSCKHLAYIVANIMLLFIFFLQIVSADATNSNNSNIFDKSQYFTWKQYADQGLAPYNPNNPQVNAWVKTFDGNGPANSNGACALVSFAIQAARAGIDLNPKKVYQRWGSVYANWQYPGITNVAMIGNVSSSAPFGKKKALSLIEKYCHEGCFLILGGRNWAHSAPASHFVALRSFNVQDKSFSLYDPARDSKDAQSAGSDDDFLNKITQIVAISGPVSWQEAQKNLPAPSGLNNSANENTNLLAKKKESTNNSDSLLHKFFSPFFKQEENNHDNKLGVANNDLTSYHDFENQITDFSDSFIRFSKNAVFYLFFAVLSLMTTLALFTMHPLLQGLVLAFNRKSAIQLPIITNKDSFYQFICHYLVSTTTLLLLSSGIVSKLMANILLKISN